MTLVKHLTYSSLAALALAPILRRRVVPFWLAAVLIDVDHPPGMIRRCGLSPLALITFALSFRLPTDREPVGFQMSRPLHHPADPAHGSGQQRRLGHAQGAARRLRDNAEMTAVRWLLAVWQKSSDSEKLGLRESSEKDHGGAESMHQLCPALVRSSPHRGPESLAPPGC